MSYIGIAGQAQQGKDTLADYLQEKLNMRRVTGNPDYPVTAIPNWTRSAFAKAVKQIFCDTFAKDLDYTEHWKVRSEVPPDLDMTVRKALQFIGDGFRQIKGSIWIDIMFRGETNKIISDVRYVNELRAVHDHGGFNILVVRPGMVNDDPNGSEAQMRPFAQHALWQAGLPTGMEPPNIEPRKLKSTWSLEANQFCGGGPPEGWDLVNYVIVNDGDVSDLYRKADAIVPLIEQFFAKKEKAA